jgi:hypothetical protein
MKLLASLSVVAATLALSSPVFAQAATKNVVVTADLTSVCRFAATGDLTTTVAYTAFQGTAASNTGTAGVECTRRTTAPTFTFDSSVGVVAGLTYTLATTYAETSSGAEPDGTAGSTGAPRTGTVTVTATIPANQAGSGAGGQTAATAKVLTVTF